MCPKPFLAASKNLGLRTMPLHKNRKGKGWFWGGDWKEAFVGRPRPRPPTAIRTAYRSISIFSKTVSEHTSGKEGIGNGSATGQERERLASDREL